MKYLSEQLKFICIYLDALNEAGDKIDELNSSIGNHGSLDIPYPTEIALTDVTGAALGFIVGEDDLWWWRP